LLSADFTVWDTKVVDERYLLAGLFVVGSHTWVDGILKDAPAAQTIGDGSARITAPHEAGSEVPVFLATLCVSLAFGARFAGGVGLAIAVALVVELVYDAAWIRRNRETRRRPSKP
jgi:hypothetical protein